MSRCVLDNEETGNEVVIGWDVVLCTFFAQVVESGCDEPKIWLGVLPSEFMSPDALIEAVHPYACAFSRDVLATNLIFDKQNKSGRLYAIDGDQVW